jgi:hypothetical protein
MKRQYIIHTAASHARHISEVFARQTLSVLLISASALSINDNITQTAVISADVRNTNAAFPKDSFSLNA